MEEGRELLDLSHHSSMTKHWNKLLASININNMIILVQRHLPSLNSMEEMGDNWQGDVENCRTRCSGLRALLETECIWGVGLESGKDDFEKVVSIWQTEKERIVAVYD